MPHCAELATNNQFLVSTTVDRYKWVAARGSPHTHTSQWDQRQSHKCVPNTLFTMQTESALSRKTGAIVRFVNEAFVME